MLQSLSLTSKNKTANKICRQTWRCCSRRRRCCCCLSIWGSIRLLCIRSSRGRCLTVGGLRCSCGLRIWAIILLRIALLQNKHLLDYVSLYFSFTHETLIIDVKTRFAKLSNKHVCGNLALQVHCSTIWTTECLGSLGLPVQSVHSSEKEGQCMSHTCVQQVHYWLIYLNNEYRIQYVNWEELTTAVHQPGCNCYNLEGNKGPERLDVLQTRLQLRNIRKIRMLTDCTSSVLL